MRILFASSEVAPFIKTGGLADVAGSLPKALAQEGHDVKVILPLYEGVGEQWRSQMKFEQYYNVTLSWRHVYCGVFSLEQDGVTYWFVDNEYYFKRWQLYGHFDDCERFAYFSRAVIETPGHFGWAPDIIHCNDWQTALVPVYLLEERYRIPQLSNTRTLGVTEGEIIDIIERATVEMCLHERLAREKLAKEKGAELYDKVLRSYGILTNAYKLASAV